jgi:hypothetical protein
MQFFEAIRDEAAPVEQFRAAAESANDFVQGSARLGRERGFIFEPSDVTATLDALTRKNETELSEGDLSAVAGGFVARQNTGACLGSGGPGRLASAVCQAVTGGCTTALLATMPIPGNRH